jgi:hypothetical protein
MERRSENGKLAAMYQKHHAAQYEHRYRESEQQSAIVFHNDP